MYKRKLCKNSGRFMSFAKNEIKNNNQLNPRNSSVNNHFNKCLSPTDFLTQNVCIAIFRKTSGKQVS